MYISKSESESMHEIRCREYSNIIMRHIWKTCDKYTKHAINKYGQFKLYKLGLWIHGVIRQGDNPNKETLIYIPHIRCHHHLNLYNLSCPQGNRTRVCLE